MTIEWAKEFIKGIPGVKHVFLSEGSWDELVEDWKSKEPAKDQHDHLNGPILEVCINGVSFQNEQSITF